MCDRAEFFGKNPHRAKIAKNGQKWPQNRVFGLFKKIMLLVLSGICVKRKFYGSLTFCEKCLLRKNGSRPMGF